MRVIFIVNSPFPPAPPPPAKNGKHAARLSEKAPRGAVTQVGEPLFIGPHSTRQQLLWLSTDKRSVDKSAALSI